MLSSGVNNWLNSVYFTDANTGFAVGQSGTIIKTINGGTTWTVLSSGTTNHLLSVYFTDANTGFAVGQSGTIIKTINGGITWSNISSGTGNLLRSVYFTDANTGYVVGNFGTILKTTDGGVSYIEEPVSSRSTLNIYPNPATGKITIETSGDRRECTLAIVNIEGQELITRQINQPKTQLDISNLPSGVYFVRVTNDGTVEVGKIIKH